MLNLSGNSRKSQLFSFDFVFSIILLILILSMVGSTWFSLQNSILRQEEQKSAVESSGAALDFLVSSQGYPDSWEKSNSLSLVSVYNLGLKGSGGISLEKTLAFGNLTASNYADVKYDLGLGAFQFRFFASENQSAGTPALSGVARSPIAYFASDYRDFVPVLSASNATWDYYWGQGLQPTPNDWGNSRNHYSGVKSVVFDQMLANQSAYKAIIVETPELLYSAINSTLWQKFFDEGGVMVYLAGNSETDPMINSTGVVLRKSSSTVNAMVLQRGFFLNNVSVSQSFPSAGQWVAYSTSNDITVYAANSTNASEAVVGAWNYSYGRVYFVNNLWMNFSGVQGKDALNIIGWPIDYGIPPLNSSQFVFPVTRFGFIESDKRIPVTFNLVVWSD